MISIKYLESSAIIVREFVPFEMAQISESEFVPFEMAQIPTILFSIGWTNHQIIMSRCKSDNERLFYILFAQKEQLQNKQLERAIKTDTMASILRAKDSQSDVLHTTYAKSPAMFKDTAYLDFLVKLIYCSITDSYNAWLHLS